VAVRTYTAQRGGASAESTDRVLEAAERLIAEGEFHSTTMDELAAAAGISRATVFNRLGSKLGVLEALAERCVACVEMRALKEAVEIEDPVRSLEAVIEASCSIWEARGFILEQLQAIVVLEPEAATLIDQQRGEQRTHIQQLTRRLARAGLLRPGLGAARAAATLHTLTGLESYLRLRREYGLSERRTRETIAELARTVLRS
jgi:AcrR family transcriptional regulator